MFVWPGRRPLTWTSNFHHQSPIQSSDYQSCFSPDLLMHCKGHYWYFAILRIVNLKPSSAHADGLPLTSATESSWAWVWASQRNELNRTLSTPHRSWITPRCELWCLIEGIHIPVAACASRWPRSSPGLASYLRECFKRKWSDRVARHLPSLQVIQPTSCNG